MASTHCLVHHLVFKPPSSSYSPLLIKSLALSLTLNLHKPLSTPFHFPHSSLPSPPPRFFCRSSSSTASSSSSSLTYQEIPSTSALLEPNNDLEDEFQHQQEEEEEGEALEAETPIKASPSVNNAALKLPTLTVKEKKELTAYAHSLGKKLKIQQVGKSGITQSVAAAFVENLESNELLKLKIQNSCPGELPDVIKQLEVTTGSVAIGQIGRSVILYRPSLTKLKAEEKKREARGVFVRKGFRPRPTVFRVKPAESRSKSDESKNKKVERRGDAPRMSGRRGRSRSELP